MLAATRHWVQRNRRLVDISKGVIMPQRAAKGKNLSCSSVSGLSL